MNDTKKKLSIDELQVDSFVNSNNSKDAVGGWTGDCLSFINITCPAPCGDIPSIPVSECLPHTGPGGPGCGGPIIE